MKETMISGLFQIETRGLNSCPACLAEVRDLDKFCRHCGARLNRFRENDSACFAPSRHNACQIAQGSYQSISGALVWALATGIPRDCAAAWPNG